MHNKHTSETGIIFVFSSYLIYLIVSFYILLFILCILNYYDVMYFKLFMFMDCLFQSSLRAYITLFLVAHACIYVFWPSVSYYAYWKWSRMARMGATE